MNRQNDNENLLIQENNSVIEERPNFSNEAPIIEVEDDEKIGKDNSDGYILNKYNRHSKFEKPKKKSKKKVRRVFTKVLIAFLCTLLSLVIIIVGAFGFLYYSGQNSIFDLSAMNLTPPDESISVIDKGNYINYKGHLYRYKDSMTSVLFMGVDKSYEEQKIDNVIGDGGQADAIYLVAMDMDNGRATTFQISRNAMCDIDLYSISGDYVGTEKAQVCLAHAYGDGKESSANNMVKSIRRIFFGLPVAQSYATIDTDAVSELNDLVGGVTVTSPVDLEGYNGEMIYEQGKTYELHGDDAEDFIRSRNMTKVDSNTNRMARQKAYLDQFVGKVISTAKNDITSVVDLYNGASPYMTTDLSLSKVTYLATELLRKGVTSADIQKVPGTEKMGKEYAEFYIDNTEFFDMLVKTFYVQAD